jgi:pSer/pThr/pTyr-binding forkhead associated (FHA) protein
LTLGGDATNDLVLSGRGISERHARLERFGSGALFVTDADSTNGTWVEGVRLERGERRLLRPGQRVVLGQDVEFEVLAPEIPS